MKIKQWSMKGTGGMDILKVELSNSTMTEPNIKAAFKMENGKAMAGIFGTMEWSMKEVLKKAW